MVPKTSRRTLARRTLRLSGVEGMGMGGMGMGIGMGMGMGIGMGMGTIIIIIATVGDIIIITTVGGHGAMAGVTGSATWAFSK